MWVCSTFLLQKGFTNQYFSQEPLKLNLLNIEGSNQPHKIRQLLIKGLGNQDKPTVMITNQMDRSPTQLIERNARRMVIENVISDSIKFFHMDALSSVVPMRINVNTQLTVMDSELYRLLGVSVGNGYECAEADTIFRDLVRLSSTITISEDDTLVKLHLRAKSGLLKKAGYNEFNQESPGLIIKCYAFTSRNDHDFHIIKSAREFRIGYCD